MNKTLHALTFATLLPLCAHAAPAGGQAWPVAFEGANHTTASAIVLARRDVAPSGPSNHLCYATTGFILQAQSGAQAEMPKILLARRDVQPETQQGVDLCSD